MYDGDLINVIDNKTFIKGIKRDLPIVIDIDDKITTLEETYNLDNLTQLVLRTIHSLIGETSNCATSYYNKNLYYKNNNGDYVDGDGNMVETPIVDYERKKKYLEYIDLLSIINGKNIDFSKTGVMFNIPRHIAKYSKPLPYFMKYAGDYYKNLKKFSYVDTNMNIMCRQIENWEKKIIKPTSNHKIDKDFDYKIMMNADIPVDINKLIEIENIFLDFYKEMSELSSEQYKFKNYKHKANYEWIKENYPDLDASLIPDFEFDWDMYYSEYMEKCKSVCKNSQELANLATIICYEKYPNKSKRFLWKVASHGILENLKQNSINPKLPIIDESGEYEYLGKRFSIKDIDILLNESESFNE